MYATILVAVIIEKIIPETENAVKRWQMAGFVYAKNLYRFDFLVGKTRQASRTAR